MQYVVYHPNNESILFTSNEMIQSVLRAKELVNQKRFNQVAVYQIEKLQVVEKTWCMTFYRYSMEGKDEVRFNMVGIDGITTMRGIVTQ